MEILPILILINGYYFHIFVSNNNTNKTMDKFTEKKDIVWNKEAINILSKRWSIGKDYIKKIIKDERTPVNADAVKKEYERICHNLAALETNKTINKL